MRNPTLFPECCLCNRDESLAGKMFQKEDVYICRDCIKILHEWDSADAHYEGVPIWWDKPQKELPKATQESRARWKRNAYAMLYGGRLEPETDFSPEYIPVIEDPKASEAYFVSHPPETGRWKSELPRTWGTGTFLSMKDVDEAMALIRKSMSCNPQPILISPSAAEFITKEQPCYSNKDKKTEKSETHNLQEKKWLERQNYIFNRGDE